MDDGLPLTTERLVLRRVARGDARDLSAIYGNRINAQFEFWPAWSTDRVNELIQLQKTVLVGDPGVPLVLVAVEQDSNQLIGAVELTIRSIEDKQGEIGFSFNSQYWGQGFATEAVNAALGFAFSQLSLHRVYCGTDTRNERSWKLMERVGMRREAHFVHANLENDQWIDDYTYAILDEEWILRNQ